MQYCDLHDDVKLSISMYLLSDFKNRMMFSSKHQVLQKILFGEIVFGGFSITSLMMIFVKFKKIQIDVKENNDFQSAKIYKIYKDINDVIDIGSTCSWFTEMFV